MENALRDQGDGKSLFGTAHDRKRAEYWQRHQDGKAQSGADRTRMRARPAGIEVGQEMKLGSEEKNQEQQADQAAVCANRGHVTGRTQLR